MMSLSEQNSLDHLTLTLNRWKVKDNGDHSDESNPFLLLLYEGIYDSVDESTKIFRDQIVKKITLPVLIVLAMCAVFLASFQAINSFTDFKVLPVNSNLMSPTIRTGSLLIMKKTPESELKTGDVISVGLPNQPVSSVGRLIEASTSGEGFYNLTFKGDNRILPEAFPYTVKDSTYVYQLGIPLLGFLVTFLSSPFGLVILSAASLYFAWYYLFKMHDRVSWAERSAKRTSYARQVARERAATRKIYGGVADLKNMFEEREPETNE